MSNSPKTFSALIDFFLELRDLLKKPRFRSILVWMVILLKTGTIFYNRVENWSILDSFYFSIVTLTTVGYGDISPTTSAGKIFTIFYILSGLAIITASISVLSLQRQITHTQQIGKHPIEEDPS